MEKGNNNTESLVGEKTNEILISRVIHASHISTFYAWSDKEQLEEWYAPDEAEIEIYKFDFVVGGIFLHKIKTSSSYECICKGEFKEIIFPTERKEGKIIYSISFSDMNGKLVLPSEVGMHEGWPAETIISVTFAPEDGKTRLTLHQTVSETLAKKTGAYPSWLQMLDKLQNFLIE